MEWKLWAAQPHHGSRPRFMAQPPLYPTEPFQLHRDDGSYCPVEIAIRLGLGLQITTGLESKSVYRMTSVTEH